MKTNNRLNRLERCAQALQDRVDINSVIWADGPPLAVSIEEWEALVRWQQGLTNGSDIRPEYRQACEAFFERQRLGKVYTKMECYT
jgi:hypothetical protein